MPSPLILAALAAFASVAPASNPSSSSSPQDALDTPAEARGFHAPGSWLTLGRVDPRGRHPFLPDAVLGRYLVEPEAPRPVAGDEVVGATASASWAAAEAGSEGGVGGGVGWAFGLAVSESPRVVLAKVSGASTFFVEGAGFAGDVYRYGWGGVPVALGVGETPVFVTGIRGAFDFQLEEPPALAFVADFDATLPDAVAGEPLVSQAGFLVMHAGQGFLGGVQLELVGEGLHRTAARLERPLVPLEVTKVGVPLLLRGAAGEAKSEIPFEVVLSVGGKELHRQSFKLRVRPPEKARRVTRWSGQDDSVQRFAVLPPTEIAERADGADEVQASETSDAEGTETGVVLSLHGASVDAINQASSYGGYSDLWVVAPTNRRPFGFDWQDWGRRDAYEALAWARANLGVDPARTYLTGHSMGGHGTWHLAANDPDTWAAIAPSAGWESFDSYGGRPDDSWNGLWYDADAASRTRDLVGNLAQLPIYVLHGTDDDNVPPSEAELMLGLLREAGAEPASHFEEGAGHWWDGHDAPGAQCLDWPGFRELFAETRVPAAPMDLDFTTVDPGVDARHFWIEVLQPRVYGRSVRVQASATGEGVEHRLRVETENCRALVVEPPHPRETLTIEIDGELLAPPAWAKRVALLFDGEQWTLGEPGSGEKRPGRTGPFKRAFDHGFVLVFGTGGDERETAELLARARYDASVWWYRGNGRAPIVADFAFRPEERRAGTNVILYGNRESNSAWSRLLPEGTPLDVSSKGVRLGGESWEGGALGAVFLQPLRGDDDALVGAIGSTDARAARLGYALKPFVSGVGYPDYAVYGGDLTQLGDRAVRAAGWWGPGWGLEQGVVGVREAAADPAR